MDFTYTQVMCVWRHGKTGADKDDSTDEDANTRNVLDKFKSGLLKWDDDTLTEIPFATVEQEQIQLAIKADRHSASR